MKTEANDATFNETNITEMIGNRLCIKESRPGLTKREHFASLAMQGILAEPPDMLPVKEMAKLAVHAADALIEALNESRS